MPRFCHMTPWDWGNIYLCRLYSKFLLRCFCDACQKQRGLWSAETMNIGPTKKSRVRKSKRASYSVRISVVRGIRRHIVPSWWHHDWWSRSIDGDDQWELLRSADGSEVEWHDMTWHEWGRLGQDRTQLISDCVPNDRILPLCITNTVPNSSKAKLYLEKIE
jgi:hypothetical protein